MFSLLTITNVDSNLTWSLILTWFLKLSWVELVIDWFIDSLTWLNLMTGPRVNEVKWSHLIMNWKVTWFVVGIDIHWKMNNRMVLAVILQSWKLNSTMRMKASRINEVEISSIHHCRSWIHYSSLYESDNNLVDPASSHTLVSKIKPCMCKSK